jgi:hypothetical protein
MLSGYVAPHPNTVRRSLKQLYKLHSVRLTEKLRDVECLSITCDFWSNRVAKSFLVLTGHYLSSTFELKTIILDFTYFDQRHFADNIADEIRSKLEKLGVLKAVTAVTCDGAANMKKAFEKFTNVDRLWCLAHRLHLIVTNALGFWLKIPVAGVDDNTDNELDSDAIENESGPSTIDEFLEDDDQGHTVDDGECCGCIL